ncbi:M15 family metallopeptidase [Aneurinibacillus terranovensis]|uniref:M15 family metallopeptidase n=1 Tax=Aneurinibacillus terranovensis TaxID=278991 RepID=UPI000412B6BF|nr:M15 family metallopeptidase [Aneurinibacillus terranovensis]
MKKTIYITAALSLLIGAGLFLTTQEQTSLNKTLPTLSKNVMENGKPEVTDVTSMLVIVNKKRNLQSEYVPPDLVQPNIPFSFPGKSPKKLMRKEAANALEQLFAGAKKDHIDLLGQSAYRSYTTQETIFTRYAREKGVDIANLASAFPGQSEHQTGLAIDLTSHREGNRLEEDFADTPEGRWLAKHAPEYGFIIRYPKGKEAITGYSYEPWHIRYVGKEVAEEISAKGIALEEYFAK